MTMLEAMKEIRILVRKRARGFTVHSADPSRLSVSAQVEQR